MRGEAARKARVGDAVEKGRISVLWHRTSAEPAGFAGQGAAALVPAERRSIGGRSAAAPWGAASKTCKKLRCVRWKTSGRSRRSPPQKKRAEISLRACESGRLILGGVVGSNHLSRAACRSRSTLIACGYEAKINAHAQSPTGCWETDRRWRQATLLSRAAWTASDCDAVRADPNGHRSGAERSPRATGVRGFVISGDQCHRFVSRLKTSERRPGPWSWSLWLEPLGPWPFPPWLP